jgi:hypothetical protein
MIPTLNNSKPRKSLADQINRLDKILDGLSDNLSEAVSDSVRDAVSVAVKQAITDVLTNPELLKRLQEAQSAAAPAQPNQPILERAGQAMASLWNRVKAVAKAGCQKTKAIAKASCQRARTVAVNGVVLARAKARIALKRVRLAVRVFAILARKAKKLFWEFRKPALVAAGIGAAIGLRCYFAGPYLVAMVARASCGGVAGAAAEWLPKIERLIPPRFAASKPASA